jgi:hypothetical protein
MHRAEYGVVQLAICEDVQVKMSGEVLNLASGSWQGARVEVVHPLLKALPREPHGMKSSFF